MPGSLEEAFAVVAASPENARYLDDLLRLVDGFETPHSVELLATVHYAASQEPRTIAPEAFASQPPVAA